MSDTRTEVSDMKFGPFTFSYNDNTMVVGEVATFLGLDGAEDYTFHSLQRTSASCAADQG